jgi:hypothetical protein
LFLDAHSSIRHPIEKINPHTELMQLNRLDETWQNLIKIFREKENLLVLKGVPRFMAFPNYCKLF